MTRASWRDLRLEGAMRTLLAPAGIELGGTRPHDIRVLDERFYTIGLRDGLSGIRDAFVEGWWETDRLDDVTHRMLISDASRLTLAANAVVGRITNLQSIRKANQARAHYDLGDDLFASMLDRRRIYSCAYWAKANTLDEAQEAKLDLVCRKLKLVPGMRVLDIGCGWGGFARYAAEQYGVSVVALTVSRGRARNFPSRSGWRTIGRWKTTGSMPSRRSACSSTSAGGTIACS
jgi:cyclopropane-fatty-acyl-phospholipid synthase